jgi:A/G-specific adenine glycosylase
MVIGRQLLDWYYVHRRDLPWRGSVSAYEIWISEIILQQTRIEQGTPYYLKFLHQFPDVETLASADEQQVLRAWQGLGYYSRARNLHAAARIVYEKYHGNFPHNYDEIRSLPGIGDYTAAAVLSLAFGQPYPVVDGNVIRFLARLFGIDQPSERNVTKKKIREIAADLMSGLPPGDFNQAMMEFGAMVCTPANPGCDSCDFAGQCRAYLDNAIDRIPFKKRRSQPVELFFKYLVITFNRNSVQMIYLRHRDFQGIWKNMYDFPCFESATDRSFPEPCQFPGIPNHFISEADITGEFGPVQHQLTHRRLQVWFRCYNLFRDISLPYQAVPVQEVKKFPLPRLIHRFLEDLRFI